MDTARKEKAMKMRAEAAQGIRPPFIYLHEAGLYDNAKRDATKRCPQCYGEPTKVSACYQNNEVVSFTWPMYVFMCSGGHTWTVLHGQVFQKGQEPKVW